MSASPQETVLSALTYKIQMFKIETENSVSTVMDSTPSMNKSSAEKSSSKDELIDIYEKKLIKDSKQIKLVSLFCGAGGLDLGFKQAGFSTAIAFDFNQSAVESFNKNHPGKVATVVDIEKAGADGILSLVIKKIPRGSDIGIIGGPPCQGFSRANPNSKADDPRNALPKTYLQIVKALMGVYNVHFLLIENVGGIKAEKHSETFDGIIAEIESLNFGSHHEILNSVHYGVPQHRKRMLIVGLRKDQAAKFSFPKKNKKIKTVGDVIADFPSPVFCNRGTKVEESVFHPNHWTMMPRSKKFTSDYVAPAGSRSFKKVEWHEPSKTIAFGNREILVHPSGLRRLSIYEAMLLQGFPKKFKLLGTLSAQVTQVSNAVPPPLAKEIALSIKYSIIENL
ncbi:DNA cytosine methyltransferase [Duganella sp. PWIR1]